MNVICFHWVVTNAVSCDFCKSSNNISPQHFRLDNFRSWIIYVKIIGFDYRFERETSIKLASQEHGIISRLKSFQIIRAITRKKEKKKNLFVFGPAVRVFANGPGDLGSIPGRVIPKTLKMELDTILLNTQHYKVRFKGKVEQSWEWSSALPYTLV